MIPEIQRVFLQVKHCHCKTWYLPDAQLAFQCIIEEFSKGFDPVFRENP